jgi:hypothetical protein
VHEHLRDVGAVRLVLGQVEQQLHGAAQALRIVGDEQRALDGVYRNSEGAAIFHEVPAPTIEELHALLAKIITRIMCERLGGLDSEHTTFIKTFMMNDKWETCIDTRLGPSMQFT